MTKAFPKRLYVVWEYPGGDDEPFLLATESPESHAVAGDKIRAGVYVLIESTTITANVEVA